MNTVAMAFANQIRRQKQKKQIVEINTQKNDCTDLAKFKAKLCMSTYREKIEGT